LEMSGASVLGQKGGGGQWSGRQGRKNLRGQNEYFKLKNCFAFKNY